MIYFDVTMRIVSGKKTIALFVLVFLCLNIGGVLCLTYCAQVTEASSTAANDSEHLSEHCRKAKKEAEEREQISSQKSDPSCCVLPFSLFTATVDKQSRFSGHFLPEALATASIEFPKFRFSFQTRGNALPIPVYRPPPLDHSVDRIKNSVIRI